MKKIWFSLTMCLFFGTAVAQPVLTEGALLAGIDHNAQMCDFNMPAQGGAAWFDYDQDGWYDLYLTGGCGRDALYHNDGGSFSDVTLDAGISFMWDKETDGVTTGDVNRDGFPDVLVTTFKTSPNFLLMNNGDGTFSPVQWEGSTDIANSFSASFGDLNLDGWLDLYVCNWSTDMEVTIDGPSISVDATANYFYVNNGDGTFSERAEQGGVDDTLGCSLGVLFTDLDNDQDSDILVANDFGYFNGNAPNQFFNNQYPLEAFSEESASYGLDVEMNGMGVAKADINLDGILEYYITNIRNDKLLVRGASGFQDEAVQRGIKSDSVWAQEMIEKIPSVGWGVAFMDLDNDMDEDLMVANGSLGYGAYLPALDSNKLYLNDGNGYFTNISRDAGVADTYVSRALAYCDFNLDGNLDVFVGITDEMDGTVKSMLYKNVSPPQNWLQVRCRGVQNNSEGIGALLRLYTDGVMQTREIGGESSFNSQNWNVAHFGLGGNEEVDSLQVYWPGGGIDRYYNPPTNVFMGVVEGGGMVTGVDNVQEKNSDVYPNPFINTLSLKSQKMVSHILYDGKGAVVFAISTNLGEDQLIDTSSLSVGSYTLVSKGDGGDFVTRKLIKQ